MYMVEVDNYSLNGCSVYHIFRNFPLYALWITDKSSGNTSMLLLEEDKFLKFTNFPKQKLKKEVTLNCNNCTNFNCKTNHSRNTAECLSKIFYESYSYYRRYKRYPLQIKAYVLRTPTDDCEQHTHPLEIKNISVGGVQCKMGDEKLEIGINDKIKINICDCKLKDFSKNCKGCYKNESNKTLEGEIAWILDNRFGVKFTNKENIKKINSIIGDINREITKKASMP